uniref:Uncharacterized protein n=1 Tax=Takifugu rubripes TaxID=31033 RepID=A0A674NEQ2_TAKRU
MLRSETHIDFPWHSLLDGYFITEDLHSDRLGNSHSSVAKSLISLGDCECCQGVWVDITCFCQYILTGTLEIKASSIKGNVMRVTRRYTFVVLYGVAAINSIQKLTGLPFETFGLLARHVTRLATDTFLFTLRVRIDYVSFPVVTALIRASAVFHRHAGISA